MNKCGQGNLSWLVVGAVGLMQLQRRLGGEGDKELKGVGLAKGPCQSVKLHIGGGGRREMLL